MAEPPKTLKDSYRTHLGIFAVVNIALFVLTIVLGREPSEFIKALSAFSWKDGLIIAVTPIGVLMLNGLLSSDMKARMVFWRQHHPLPGSQAFTRYLNSDPRIDVGTISSLYVELPTDPSEQNRLWYKMYTDNESDVRVRDAHRNWLFARDLTGFSTLFLILFGGGAIVISLTNWWYFALLATQYTLLVWSGRIYGGRFVTTVLAVASHGD